jgi:hypothetical protein
LILCREHSFIFLKTRKTGGTSVELALSELCGPSDIITAVRSSDEALRRGRGPQNYIIKLPNRWWHRLDYGGERRHFVLYDHVPAGLVKRHIPPDLWARCRKVTIVRNPWDREASRYYFAASQSGKYADFRDFVRRRTRWHPMKNYRIHAIRGRNIADTILRFEHLQEDFADFLRALGAPVPDLPVANAASRPTTARDYRPMFDDETRAIVASC